MRPPDAQALGEQFYAAFKSILPAKPGIAVIHSSFSDLVPPLEFDRSSAVHGLKLLARDGWTVAIAAFTFSFCQGKPFRLDKSRSEVGPLADYALRELEVAQRTRHPIYSFVTFGPEAGQILDCRGETTFGRGTTFELFEHADAQFVMAGCGWKSCTQFHRYEELAGVPYRYLKAFEGEADFGAGPREIRASMLVRDLDLNPENDLAVPEATLRRSGAVKGISLWRGCLEACSAQALATCSWSLLKVDPLAFIGNKAEVRHRLDARLASHRS